MEVTIPNKFIYHLDRVNYDQRMVIHQIAFMLTHHANDINDDFLKTDIFKRLHKDLVTTTAQKWCTEIVIMKEVLTEIPNKYYINTEQAKIIVEK